MHDKIMCPYCFKKFRDTEVKFRSEYVFEGEIDDLSSREDINEAMLYKRPEYNSQPVPRDYYDFWSEVGGNSYKTSETTADVREFPPYSRPIIDPSDSSWQRQLVKVNPSVTDDKKEAYLRNDGSVDGMANAVIIKKTNLHEQAVCMRRVCPYCNNPLPQGYGKSETIFIPVIGITGAGKTVYMAALLKYINRYMASVGYNSAEPCGGYDAFTSTNPLKRGKSLPRPTASDVAQQPLFFTMRKLVKGSRNKLKEYTVVLYDLAGEYFNSADFDDSADPNNRVNTKDIENETKHRRPLLANADGIILVVDPAQLTGRNNNPAVTALNKIYKILLESSKTGDRAAAPIAVCVSKADGKDFKDYFGLEIQRIALTSANYNKKLPAEDFNNLTDKIFNVLDTDPNCYIVDGANNFEKSKFFAFSAINEDLIENNVLLADPTPYRIEDSLAWLLAMNGYCDVEGNLHNDIRCPNCGSYWTRYKEHQSADPKRFLRGQTYTTFQYVCKNKTCNCIFNTDDAGHVVGEWRFIEAAKNL